MPRTKRPIRPIPVHIHIPEDIYGQVVAALYSPLEERVPHGAVSKLITRLLADFVKKHQDASASASASAGTTSQPQDPQS